MTSPKWVVLQITEKCNLKCKMCYEWGDTGSYYDKKSLSMLDKTVIEEIFKDLLCHDVYYELFGGEPLLHPEFSEILKLIKKYKCRVDIPTNGTLLKKYASEIIEAGIERIWVSIDGPEAINDEQRGQGVYKRAIEGIKELQKVRDEKRGAKTQIGVTFVVTPLNYKYLKSFIIEEIYPMNVDYISIEFQLFITTVSYASYQNFLKENFGICNTTYPKGLIRDIDIFENINVEYLVQQMNCIKDQLKNSSTKLIGYPKYIDEENINNFYQAKWELMKEKKKECSMPWIYMEVSASGDVTPCHTFYDICMGNVYNNRIMDIWLSDNYCNFRKKMRHQITPICYACSRYYS